MRKIFNYSFLIVFLTSASATMYYLVNLTSDTVGKALCLLAFSIISFVFYTITEKNATKETQTTGYVTVMLVAVCIVIVLFASSCSRYVTVEQAANGKARCGKWVK